jgi:hypothetical protein
MDLNKYDFYILDDKIPVQVDVMEYALWLEENRDSCEIAQQLIRDVRISTSFTGYERKGYTDPLFQTVISGGALDGRRVRYYSFHEAIQGHHALCAEVIDAL